MTMLRSSAEPLGSTDQSHDPKSKADIVTWCRPDLDKSDDSYATIIKFAHGRVMSADT
jgi:hypothetical protein